jgi:monoterpene epsilon-lactone hydrolase
MRERLDSLGGRLPRDTRLDPVDAGGVPGVWLRCGDADPDRRLLYLHGGAYISGSHTSHGPLAARIGRASGAAVLLVDYRLAPEDPHPAAVEDAVRSFAWMSEHGPEGPSRAARTFVAGDSAGGGLTLATLLSARDAGGRLPDAAVTLSAWTDLGLTEDSFTTRAAIDPMIAVESMHAAVALYVGEADARTPLASPLYGDFAGFPPLFMQVGDEEVLLDDTTRVAERARSAGVDVTVEVWPEMFHVFQAFAAILPEGREAIAKVGSFLQRFG